MFNVEWTMDCRPNITEKFRKCASTSSLIDNAYKENQKFCTQYNGRVYINLYLLPTEKSSIAYWILDHFYRNITSTSSLIDNAYKENQKFCTQYNGRVYINLYLLPTEKSSRAYWILDHFYRNITHISTLIFFVGYILLSSILRNLTVHWHYVQIYCRYIPGQLVTIVLVFCSYFIATQHCFHPHKQVENCRRPVWPALVFAIPECCNINNNITLLSVKHTYIYCTYVLHGQHVSTHHRVIIRALYTTFNF
jgi:hypothetical protein